MHCLSFKIGTPKVEKYLLNNFFDSIQKLFEQVYNHNLI
jgi:hypothetical protein